MFQWWFNAVEETSNAMALDGIMFEGVTVRVRRPNDYNPAAAAALGPSVPNSALNLQAIGLNSGAGAAMVRGPVVLHQTSSFPSVVGDLQCVCVPALPGMIQCVQGASDMAP